MSEKVAIEKFKGIKNDTDPKQTSFEYFSNIVNFDFQNTSTLGLEPILYPKVLNFFEASQIDGIAEYLFLDSNNVLRQKIIVVCNGSIYFTDFTTKTLIKSGLNKGKCSFAVYLDKLLITNGIDNIQVYDGENNKITEMGAPYLYIESTGLLLGVYRYAITYVTAGGEEVIGSVSEPLTTYNNSVRVELPIGYDGTTKRRIYRTAGNGTQLKFLKEIDDNSTLTFIDNLGDYFLSTDIPETNNELPRPYFLQTAGGKLYGGKVDKYPTQLFPTTVGNLVFDLASFIDISNYSVDNTAIQGLGEDFDKIVVGTQKNIFFVNPVDDTVVLTRANVGFLDGYTLAKIPSFADFTGGLMFVSTARDIRIMTGLQSLPVSTSLDNISTLNYAQDIQGTLPLDLKSYTNIHAQYFNYRYHLQIDNVRYVFDIRNKAWTTHKVQTETYLSSPSVLSVINNQLYNGQVDGYCELEYAEVQYRNEDCQAKLESVEINASSQFSFIEKMYFWFNSSENNNMELTVTTDSNQAYKESKQFNILDGAYSEDFLDINFDTNKNGMDYRVFNIYKTCRWIKYKLVISSGSISFQNFEISGQTISNKE